MGRNPKFDRPMTAAERKALSRANLIADVSIECSCIESIVDALADAASTGDREAVRQAVDGIKQHTKAIRARVK